MNYTTEQLRNMEHEQLMELINEKKIDWSQYIDAQPDLFEGYDEWLEREGRERNNENALFFIHQVEESDMQSQMPDELNHIINEVHKAKAAL